MLKFCFCFATGVLLQQSMMLLCSLRCYLRERDQATQINSNPIQRSKEFAALSVCEQMSERCVHLQQLQSL